MTTKSQKRKAVADLASGDFETFIAENNTTENLVAGPSKNPRIEPENLEEIKTSLRREIMTDLLKSLSKRPGFGFWTRKHFRSENVHTREDQHCDYPKNNTGK